MGSSGKKRTTWAKLNREGKLRDKRVEKEARKAARRLSAGSDAGDAASRAGELDTTSAGPDQRGREGDGSDLVAAVRDVAADS